jgi:hypothetical protein
LLNEFFEELAKVCTLPPAPDAEIRGGSRRNDLRKWQIVPVAISVRSES